MGERDEANDPLRKQKNPDQFKKWINNSFILLTQFLEDKDNMI